MGGSLATALVRWLRRIMAMRPASRYRPELHYMRGPGPKSRGERGQGAVNGKGMAASLGNGGKSPAA